MEGVVGMHVKLYGKNMAITDGLRDAVEKKLGKLEKFLDAPLDASATLKVERGQHIIEVTAQMGHLILRAEEASEDMYASIDLVVDKLEAQLRKYRTRLQRRQKGGGRVQATAATLVAPTVEETDTAEEQVVKVKRFPIKPVTVEEAIMQMNLVGHDFYVFRNAETGLTSVVYRRKGGDYGLLEPAD
jgi:putative sigma-54 modulation protein